MMQQHNTHLYHPSFHAFQADHQDRADLVDLYHQLTQAYHLDPDFPSLLVILVVLLVLVHHHHP